MDKKTLKANWLNYKKLKLVLYVYLIINAIILAGFGYFTSKMSNGQIEQFIKSGELDFIALLHFITIPACLLLLYFEKKWWRRILIVALTFMMFYAFEAIDSKYLNVNTL
jgi:hypothetical protein